MCEAGAIEGTRGLKGTQLPERASRRGKARPNSQLPQRCSGLAVGGPPPRTSTEALPKNHLQNHSASAVARITAVSHLASARGNSAIVLSSSRHYIFCFYYIYSRSFFNSIFLSFPALILLITLSTLNCLREHVNSQPIQSSSSQLHHQHQHRSHVETYLPSFWQPAIAPQPDYAICCQTRILCCRAGYL